MQVPDRLGEGRVDQRSHKRLHEGAIKRKVCLRDAVDRSETALVGCAIAAKRTDVVESPRLTAHHPIAANHVGIGGGVGLGFENRLVETRWQRIDQINVARELVVLFARNLSRDENSQMTNILMDGVDDRLPAGADFINVFIEIKNPTKRLLRRGNVVPFGAKHNDRRANATKINRESAGSLDFSGGKIVADEQFIHDELYLFGIKIDMTTPPAFEAQVPGR